MKKTLDKTVLIPLELDEFWFEVRQIIRQELRKVLKETTQASALEYPQGLSEKPLYTIAEVCAVFNITRPTMYEWVRDGRLRPKKLRGRVYFVGSHIRGMIEAMGKQGDAA